MDKTQKTTNLWELTTDADHILHRTGDEEHPVMRRLMTAHPEEWEEVAVSDIPPFTKAKYDAKVAELVRERYTADEEFAIQRKMIGAMTTPSPLSEAADADSAPADSATADSPAGDGAADIAAANLDEFQAYNAYVEQCKARARALLKAETQQKQSN